MCRLKTVGNWRYLWQHLIYSTAFVGVMAQEMSVWKMREVKRGKWEEVVCFWLEMLPHQPQGMLAAA